MKSKEEIIKHRNELEDIWKQLLSEYNGIEKDNKDPLYRNLLTRMSECAASLEIINWILTDET